VQSVEFFTGEYYPFDCSGNHGIWDVNECPEVITLSKTSPCTYSSGPVGSWHHNCTSCNGCPDNCPERSGTYQWSVTFGSTISVLGWGGCGSVFEGTMTRPEPCLPVTIPNDITDWLPCCGGNPGQGGSVTLEIP
jgi:hypothetical protein